MNRLLNRTINFLSWNLISEQVFASYDVTRSDDYPDTRFRSGWLRSKVRSFQINFWGKGMPVYSGTEIDYETARSLYRGDSQKALGGGFAKPIIDLTVGMMGIPSVSSEEVDRDDFLNDCLKRFWVDEIQQVFRDAMRDSKVVVRVHRPDLFDPLMTLEEQEHGFLECIPPERVQIERNARNRNIIERAIITHRMVFVVDDGNIAEQRDPQVEEHEVMEIITRQSYRFFDKQTGEYLDELASDNRYNLVPLVEIFNEWDSSLQGGQSDLESVQPFLYALNDVITQGLQAHRYHSTPKLQMKLSDIGAFLRNNFPNAINEDGSVKDNVEISWTGREVFILQSDAQEDIAFIEAKNVLEGTKALAEFLIDCICVASQTPEWAFMRVDTGSANSDRNAQTVPYVKKIERKRNVFTKPVQDILKIILVLTGKIPVRVSLSWDYIRPDDALVWNQALQQLIMSLEVANQSGEISDETYREMIRPFMPFMKNPKKEELDAKVDQRETANALASASTNGIGNTPQPAIAAGPQGRNE